MTATTLWARCPTCDHTWRAATLPARIQDAVAELRAHTKCPQCGTPGVVARQQAGVLLEQPAAGTPA